ncbi:MAG: DMT family transporter [Endozoicomonas sp. (ex Botrylloides leachii)]|nr:DMT family transporter [Endozoicomonas sp. (ex Botrylloides leachii)]
MNKKYLPLLLFFSVCLIWGTTWIAMEMAVATIPPILATGLRFLIAAPILIFIAYKLKQPLLFPKPQQKWMLLVAICYFAIPFTLMIFGEQYISSGLAAIIFANMPIAVMVVSALFLNLRLSVHQVVGLLIAVISLCSILMNEMKIGGEDYLIGSLALGGAVIMHALTYVMIQKHCKNIKVFTYNALPCLIAAICLLATSALVETPNIHSFTVESISSVLYLGVIAGVGGVAAYFKLNEISSPFTASICFLLFPIVALTLSSFLSSHTVSKASILAMLPLLGGILLTKTEKTFWLKRFKVKKSPALSWEK